METVFIRGQVEGDGLATALGPWLPCRRGEEEARSDMTSEKQNPASLHRDASRPPRAMIFLGLCIAGAAIYKMIVPWS
jgi:hypothetical protein